MYFYSYPVIFLIILIDKIVNLNLNPWFDLVYKIMATHNFVESEKMEIKEKYIEAPWGKIAVKLWGDENDPAILTVHGVMDNAGSFDDLIPLLPKYFYICIDLPGHGKSSPFPSHLPIYSVNNVIVYSLVMDYFKKTKIIIMGHSYGGQIGLLFAQIYPEKVEKLIMFDTVHLFTIPSKYFEQYLGDKFDRFMEIENKIKINSPPQYTYQEAFDRMMQGRPSPLTEKAAKNLLNRMVIPVGEDKYIFSLDQRLKNFINLVHDNRYAVETLKHSPVNCPLLMVFGLENGAQRHILRPILNQLKKHRNISVKYVPGYHDVHQNNPELVAPLVTEFLNFKKSKL